MMQFVRGKLLRRNNTFSYSADDQDEQKKNKAEKKRNGGGGKKVRRTVPLFPALTRTASLPDDMDKAQHPFAVTTTRATAINADGVENVLPSMPQEDYESTVRVAHDDRTATNDDRGPLSAGSTPAAVRRSVIHQHDPRDTTLVLSLSSGFGSTGLFSSSSLVTTPADHLSLSFIGHRQQSTIATPDSALSLHWSSPSPTSRRRLEIFKSCPDHLPALLPPPGRKTPSVVICEETVCVTVVFEVLERGLEREVGQAVRKQMRDVLDEGMLAVWADLRWSTPARYRCPEEEMRMKTEWMSALRENGERVWDEVEENTMMGDSTTEESVVMNGRVTTAASSRKYDRMLAAMAHKQCLNEHDEWWPTSHKRADEGAIKWPAIGSPSEVTLITLNVICIKLQQQQLPNYEYGYF